MSLKTLGTSTSLGAASETAIYTVPASKEATAVLTLCNTGTTQAAIRVRVKPSADVLGNQHYVEYGFPLYPSGMAGNVYKGRFYMATGDILYAYSDTANVSASAQGDETAAT
jgi:hypothetical protein